MYNKKILGFTFWAGSKSEIITAIINTLSSHSATAYLACSLNDLAQAHKDHTRHHWYEHIDVFLPDGMPIVWYLQKHSRKLIERIYGPTLFMMLIDSQTIHQKKHVFLVANAQIPVAIKHYLQTRAIRVKKVSSFVVPFDDSNLLKIIEKVARINPDIIWIGVGSPRQAYIAMLLKKNLHHGLIICIGAAFELTSGIKAQAPAWIQSWGFEWLYRLICEPRRLKKRYLWDIPLFLLNRITHRIRESRPLLGRRKM